MDRGLGNYYRGGNARRDDRRYDDFYDRDRRGGGGNFRGGSGNRNNSRGGARDRGFFGNQSSHGGGGQNVIAALQLQQNQNLLNAYIRNQSRSNSFQAQAGGRKPSGYNNSGFRPGDKRRQESSSTGSFKKSRSSRDEDRRSSSASRSAQSKTKESKKEESKETKEEELDIPDDQVEIPDQLMDNVEKLRQRKDVERNVADEDIEKLIVFSYNGKGYDCLTCGFMLLKDNAFKNHLMSKSHVMNVIDARSDKKYQPTRDILDIDIAPDGWFEKSEMARKALLKQAKVMMKMEIDRKKRELESYNRDPSNFFAVNMASKKCATMTGDTVRITSIVESTIDVKDFSKNRFFGCEFVKSVASFQCRLCDMKIHNASEVLPHIDSRVHRNKYQIHLRRMPDYEKKQKEQNKDLGVILQEHEGQAVLLSESSSKPEDDNQGKTLLEEIDTLLVRVPEILNPPVKEDPKESEKEKEKEADEESKDKKESESTDAKESETKTENEVEKDTEETSKEEEKVEQESELKEEPMETTESVEETKTDAESKGEEEPMEETSIEKPAEESEDKESPVEEAEKEENKTEKEETKPETDEKAEVTSPAPAKKTAKKGTATRGRGTARRGTPKRNRGGKASTASPKTKAKPVAIVEPVEATVTEEKAEKPAENETENEETVDASDGSFMDGFQVVDEVQEE